ncbi:MAG: hypothetical protein JWM59_776 [Verrucomicrobiales bacterium]|nr:hypothetical protein [Verrucomicrobiales bacterium]
MPAWWGHFSMASSASTQPPMVVNLVGGMDMHRPNQPLGVHGNLSAGAFDLFAPVKAPQPRF